MGYIGLVGISSVLLYFQLAEDVENFK